MVTDRQLLHIFFHVLYFLTEFCYLPIHLLGFCFNLSTGCELPGDLIDLFHSEVKLDFEAAHPVTLQCLLHLLHSTFTHDLYLSQTAIDSVLAYGTTVAVVLEITDEETV